MIARARTGSGKTLAFALPVIEKILASSAGERPASGRLPQCVVLAPTRELAKQVEREVAGAGPRLDVGCYYGGTPIGPQLRELRRGVDVVVGTPGRIIDLIDQDALDLSQVCVLGGEGLRACAGGWCSSDGVVMVVGGVAAVARWRWWWWGVTG